MPFTPPRRLLQHFFFNLDYYYFGLRVYERVCVCVCVCMYVCSRAYLFFMARDGTDILAKRHCRYRFRHWRHLRGVDRSSLDKSSRDSEEPLDH